MHIMKKDHIKRYGLSLAPPVGLEPTTTRLTAECSTDWAMEEYICWRLPIFPGRCQPSIIGTTELNFCVRNGNRCTLCVINTNYIICITANIMQQIPKMVTRGGIEPPLPAWEAGVLTAWPTSQIGAPSGTRTRDTLIKSQVLYQLS